MPNPNQQYVQQNQNIPPELLNIIRERKKNPTGESDLFNEVVELRKEIAQLRAELKPVPTLILTGKSVLDEFKLLSGKASHD